MTKTGDLNPHYFHKPSLHFYLRIPVTSAAFLWSVKKGEMRSIKEVVTVDPAGVADHAFSVSHPRLLVWNRAFSVLLSSLTIFFLFLLLEELTTSRRVALIGTALAAVCPELIRHSATVGVDCVMGFFCMLSVFLSVRAYKRQNISLLYWSAFTAGLAVSSKYNALPICATPILASLFLNRLRPQALFIVPVLCAFGFLIATPYLFAELPRFLDQLAYEIWHYKIAGHEGHSAEPGFPQVAFYFSWLWHDALGIIAVILGFLGLLAAPKHGRAGILYSSFPVLFFLLMIEQRANFTRNMIPFVPFFCGAVGIAIFPLVSRKRYMAIIAAVLLCIIPFTKTVKLLSEQKNIQESRKELTKWLTDQNEKDIAVQSALQVRRFSSLAFPVDDISPISLWMKGFSKAILGPGADVQAAGSLEKEFAGESKIQRVVKNPSMKVVKIKDTFTPEEIRTYVAADRSSSVELVADGNGPFECKTSDQEPYCWVTSRYAQIRFKDLLSHPDFSGRDGLIRLSMKLMSPWENQKVRITFDDFLAYVDLPFGGPVNQWSEVTVDLPYAELKNSQYFIINVDAVHSPKSMGINADSRRLGVAVKEIKIIPR